MSDLRPKATIVLERLQPAFAPSQEVRQRMREAVLARAAEASAAAAAESTRASAPESGIRLVLRGSYGQLLAGALVILAVSVFATNYVTEHEESPVSAQAVGRAPSAPGVGCIEPGCAAAGEDGIDNETARSSSPSLPTLGSPYDLPDARRDRSVTKGVTTQARRPEDARGPDRDDSKEDERSSPTKGDRPEDLLGKEVRLIRDAQIALRVGDLERVRSSLDAHARAFPNGVLRDERLVLHVLVLCAEGRPEPARRAADDLVRANLLPSHLEPLRASCAGAAMH